MRDFQRSHKPHWINASLKPHEALRNTPDVRRHATQVRDLQRFHKPERLNAALKPHEAPSKTLLDQEPGPLPQGNDVPRAGGQAVDRAPDAAQNPNDVAGADGQAVDRAPDEVQAAPPSIAERETGATVGMASESRAPDVAQNTLPSIERKGTPTTGSLDALWFATVMAMVVAALGLVRFLFRRTYAKRVLAFGAKHLQPPPDYPRLVDLSWPSRNQVEADPGAASSLESVKQALSTIEEAVNEISSRQLRRRL